MILSFIEKAVAVAVIGFVVERILRNTMNYIFHPDTEDENEHVNLHFAPQRTANFLILFNK